jgi:threonine/homoserine/homoserine lactone efflux protein
MVPLPSEMPSMWDSILPYVFWLGWGLWTAVSDLHSTDVQPAVIRLVIGGAVLGFLRPNKWYLWALALSAWIPLEPIVAQQLNLTDTLHSSLLGTLLPPIPALIGGLLGRTVKRTL